MPAQSAKRLMIAIAAIAMSSITVGAAVSPANASVTKIAQVARG